MASQWPSINFVTHVKGLGVVVVVCLLTCRCMCLFHRRMKRNWLTTCLCTNTWTGKMQCLSRSHPAVDSVVGSSLNFMSSYPRFGCRSWVNGMGTCTLTPCMLRGLMLVLQVCGHICAANRRSSRKLASLHHAVSHACLNLVLQPSFMLFLLSWWVALSLCKTIAHMHSKVHIDIVIVLLVVIIIICQFLFRKGYFTIILPVVRSSHCCHVLLYRSGKLSTSYLACVSTLYHPGHISIRRPRLCSKSQWSWCSATQPLRCTKYPSAVLARCPRSGTLCALTDAYASRTSFVPTLLTATWPHPPCPLCVYPWRRDRPKFHLYVERSLKALWVHHPTIHTHFYGQIYDMRFGLIV